MYAKIIWKMLVTVSFFSTLNCSASNNSLSDLEDLRLVHLLFRHGDRTPISPYPKDPYRDVSYWPVGFGQLTSKGKMQQYELGKWIRNRYKQFLSQDYRENEILVRSTDVDRTLMSAQATLAGLYPPEGYLKWNKNLTWQPVPVHTVPKHEDALLSSHANCPRFQQLREDVLKSDFMSNIYQQNLELFQYVSNHVGENITDIVRLKYVYDTLFIESISGFELPKWTEKVYPGDGRFKELADLSFTVNSFNEEMKRLKGGPLINEIVQNSDTLTRGELRPEGRKIYMYSAHDTTIAPVLHTLGIFNLITPPYSSLVLFEIFLIEDEWYVRIMYKNDSSREPYLLTLPGCEPLCKLSKFKELTENVRISPEDLEVECGLKETETLNLSLVVGLAAIISSFMALTVLLSLLINFCWKNEPNKLSSSNTTRYHKISQVELH